MKQCLFYLSDGVCKALRSQKCKGCKFAKTEKEFLDGLAKAEDALAQKGLEKQVAHRHDGAYVTVRRK